MLDILYIMTPTLRETTLAVLDDIESTLNQEQIALKNQLLLVMFSNRDICDDVVIAFRNFFKNNGRLGESTCVAITNIWKPNVERRSDLAKALFYIILTHIVKKNDNKIENAMLQEWLVNNNYLDINAVDIMQHPETAGFAFPKFDDPGTASTWCVPIQENGISHFQWVFSQDPKNLCEPPKVFTRDLLDRLMDSAYGTRLQGDKKILDDLGRSHTFIIAEAPPGLGRPHITLSVMGILRLRGEGYFESKIIIHLTNITEGDEEYDSSYPMYAGRLWGLRADGGHNTSILGVFHPSSGPAFVRAVKDYTLSLSNS